MSTRVLSVENLSKRYQLGMIGYGSLMRDLQAWTARVRRKEDPNAKIGGVSRLDMHGEFWALKDVTFDVAKGESLGIIGRNGAGKSTLLKILSRTTAPTEGIVRVKGKSSSLLEVGTGFHPELTGRENVFLNGTILGMRRREIERKFDEIVAFSEIETFIDTPVKRYSSGMYVRLAFSVAAHFVSDILILDEVLAVGDAEFQRKCLEKMEREIHENGRTVLFVSHGMASIKNLCSRCIWLDKGKIVETGEAVKVVNNYLRWMTGSKIEVNDAECVFERDLKKEIQLVRARVHNRRGMTTKHYNCDETVNIELALEKRREVKGMYGYLEIRNFQNDVILVSDSNDLSANTFDTLKLGENLMDLAIPPRILGVGDYRIYLNITYRDGSNADAPGIIGNFRIDEVTSSRGNGRGGYLSTLLKWNHRNV